MSLLTQQKSAGMGSVAQWVVCPSKAFIVYLSLIACTGWFQELIRV